jgi:hypothetical protein
VAGKALVGKDRTNVAVEVQSLYVVGKNGDRRQRAAASESKQANHASSSERSGGGAGKHARNCIHRDTRQDRYDGSAS